MRGLRQLPIGLVLAVLITACEPSITELRRDLDKGVGGFTGPIAPFSVPYDLRYEPSMAAFNTTTTTTVDGTSPVTTSARVRQRVSALGGQRLVEAWVEEISEGGQVYRSSGSPMVTIRQLMSPKGVVAEIDVAFTGVRDAPAPGTPEHSKWATLFKEMMGPLPGPPVGVGSVMFTGADAAARLFEGLILSEFLTRDQAAQLLQSPTHNSLAARVAGRTTKDGRTLLVVELSGAVRYTVVPRGAIGFGMTGHGLVDPLTGLYQSFVVAQVVRIERDRRPDLFIEAITRREASP